MGKTFSTGLLTNGIWQDSSNNIGIGAANSSYKFQVTGTTNLTGALSGTSATFSGNISTTNATFFARASGTESSNYQFSAITLGYDATNVIGWITAGGEAARTNLILQQGGGKVGIGANNFGGDAVLGVSKLGAEAIEFAPAFSTNKNRILSYNRTSSIYNSLMLSASDIDFAISGTTKLLLNSAGNLGLGVTPSSWGSPFIAFQGGTYGQYVGFQTNGPDMKLGTNHYYNGSGYIYTVSSNGAAQINLGGNSGFQFNIAPSGTAGNAVTFSTVMSVTSAGITTSGNITASVAGSAHLFLDTTPYGGAYAYNMQVKNNAGNGNFYIQRTSDGTGVYIPFGGTSWGGVSDERLKTDLVEIQNATEKVLQLRTVTGRFKTDEVGKSRSFFIAQDMQKVFPEAVNYDEENDVWGIQYTDTIPLMAAAIKELKAEIDQLKNK